MSAAILGTIMAFAVISCHYYALLITTTFAKRAPTHYIKSLGVVSFIFVVHIIEILWFAFNIYIVHDVLDYDGFASSYDPSMIDYIHLSASAFTTLGVANSVPVGVLAVFIDFIALTGFMMFTWSATHYYNIVSKSNSPT